MRYRLLHQLPVRPPQSIHMGAPQANSACSPLHQSLSCYWHCRHKTTSHTSDTLDKPILMDDYDPLESNTWLANTPYTPHGVFTSKNCNFNGNSRFRQFTKVVGIVTANPLHAAHKSLSRYWSSLALIRILMSWWICVCHMESGNNMSVLSSLFFLQQLYTNNFFD